MIRVGVVGLGKMGLSHLSMVRAHPEVEVAGVCDSAKYVLDVLGKYTGIPTYTDYGKMLDTAALDAVIIATPTNMHAGMVRTALDRGLHVFCEKPFVLDPGEGDELAALAAQRALVTQVGYHNHFVGAFREVKRLLDLGAIGHVVGGLAEAYGPVVLKPAGRTWRSSKSAGGGALYDYAAHPLDLLMWYLGEPSRVTGRVTTVFSREIDDLVAATLHYPDATVQLNVNWSDESQRKMTTKITLWGTHGRIYADRQEVQVFLRDEAAVPTGYSAGWNVRYTTDLSEAPYFYVRGEEYSGQLDEFVRRITKGEVTGENDFTSALRADRTIAAVLADSQAAPQIAPTAASRQVVTEPTYGEQFKDLFDKARRDGTRLGRQASARLSQWLAERKQR